MKKIYFALLFAAFNLHAVSLRLTKAIADHNLYVFEDKYVIKTSIPLVGIYIGNYMEVDIDFFYTQDQWLQTIVTTEYKRVGTTYDTGTDAYVDEYGDVYLEDYVESQDHYAYVDTVTSYTFTPIGIMDKKPMDLITFTHFADARAGEQPLKSYTSLYTDTGWVWSDKQIARQNFPSVLETGVMVDITWLVNEYASYPSDFTHRIYPIHDRNNPMYLRGIMNCGYVRKLFLHDYVNSLALFEYN